MATDGSSLVFEFLKSDADTASVRALLVGGADSVFEAGDLTARILSDAEEARRAAAVDKALALAVQDAGEDPMDKPNVFAAAVVVRVYDRFCGYRNIRATREALKEVVVGAFAPLDGGRGLLLSRYGGRTGHRYDPVFAVEYEAITFVLVIVEPERL